MSARGTGQPGGRHEPVGGLKRLAGHGGLYTLSNVAVKGAGLVLLVLYLDPELLSVVDYGRLGLLEAAAQLLAVVCGLGVGSGLLRYTAGRVPEGTSDEDVRALPATALLASAACAAAAFGLPAAFRRPLAAFLLDDPSASAPVLLMGAYAAVKVVQAVPLAYFRARERVGLYVSAMGVETLLLLAGVWYALAVQRAGLLGVLAAWTAASGLAAALLVGGLLWKAGALPRPRLLRPLLRFGVPLVAAAVAGVALNTADRFLLKAFADASEVALYVLAAKYGGLVNMALVQSFNLAFSVLGLKALAAGDFGLHRSAFRHFAVIAGWVALGIGLFAVDLTRVLSAEQAYQGVDPLVLPVAIGFWAYGLYYVPLNALLAGDRTRAAAGGAMGAATLNVALNVALIPSFGAAGAAWATFLAYAVLALGTARLAGTEADLRLPWGKAGLALALVLGLWGLGLTTAGWPTAPRLAARAGLALAYVPAIFAVGIYDGADLGRGVEWARGLLRR